MGYKSKSIWDALSVFAEPFILTYPIAAKRNPAKMENDQRGKLV